MKFRTIIILAICVVITGVYALKKLFGADLDCKITAFAPTREIPDDRMGVNKEEQEGEENKQVNTVEPPAADNKKSIVAVPANLYQL